ncbi:oxidoreductase [Anaerobacillus arseniciselenatis]|uniref:Oxidoreductase n=1 Tax=Anaerobacillus arseniciselenatis TaxID=85682 RepID=A0A1S2LN12_9BACI|nr:oxidoreductase [Anaerobacillus arseniciselenatis]
MTKVRWGILSTANIAQKAMIPAIGRSENAEVVAIASSSGKAKEVADAFNIKKTYHTYEQMLRDEEIDAIYIPLPNHLHKKWTMEAAKHGKHVLCEKPASLTAEDTKEMIDFCKVRGVHFMEAFMYQFHPQHDTVRAIIASGEIGEVKLMRASFSFLLNKPKGNIRMDRTKGGGSIYDVGCYSIHVIRNVLQVEPTEIFIHANIDQEHQVDTSAVGYLKLENGVSATFDSSFEMAFRNEYEIIGTKGQIKVPRAFRPDIHGDQGIVILQTEDGTKELKVVGDVYRMQVERFSQAILEEEDLSSTWENSIRNMKVIDACYKAIETGKIINI